MQGFQKKKHRFFQRTDRRAAAFVDVIRMRKPSEDL